jgi:catechol 2,3-dioxygenase-like lactoylglutathione lyase family enzyme
MIGRLNHVAIVVPDLAAAASTYREVRSAHGFPRPRTCLNTA